jgi:hypothetical protein
VAGQAEKKVACWQLCRKYFPREELEYIHKILLDIATEEREE